jgi:hypothetical protein
MIFDEIGVRKRTADIHKVVFNSSIPVRGLVGEYFAYTTTLVITAGGSGRNNNHGQNDGKLT